MDQTQIYVPLRCNAGWFGDPDCRQRLERKLKIYSVLYDQVLFEDGRCHVSAGVDNQGMQMRWPGASYPGDRKKISFFAPESKFGVAFGGKQLFQSASFSSYEIDFLPIVCDAGIEDSTFIRWSNLKISPQLDGRIKQQVEADIAGKNYQGCLPENKYLASFLLESVYRDCSAARHLKLPFSVDLHSAPIIDRLRQNARMAYPVELPTALFDYWLTLDLPDFASLSWSEVCDLRETDAGISFRRMIHDVANRAKAALPDIHEQHDCESWLAKEFNKEVLKELSNRIVSPRKAVASLCLNIIPFGIFPSVAKDISALCSEQESWVSLVREYHSANQLALHREHNQRKRLTKR
jgi:hypothetical protein